MQYQVKATDLQRKTFEILKENPTMPLGQAMRQAGYAPKTAEAPKQNYLEKRGIQNHMEEWKGKLRGSGLNEDFLLIKYHEWINATKLKSSLTEPDKEVPDYETQLKVKDDLRHDLGLGIVNDKQNGLNLNVQGEKVLIVPSELIQKHEVPSDSINSSQGQNQV